MTEFRRTGCSDPDRPRYRNAMFELLSHHRRRYVLRRLLRKGEPQTLAELADAVAALEAEAHATDLEDGATERVRVSLYHVHVPKLAEEGIVRYDRERDAVSLAVHGERAEQYRVHLDVD